MAAIPRTLSLSGKSLARVENHEVETPKPSQNATDEPLTYELGSTVRIG